MLDTKKQLDKKIQVRVTSDEKASLEKLAKNMELSISDLVRMAVNLLEEKYKSKGADFLNE